MSVVCPNCGAVNEHYGKCEYCGNVLEGDSKIEASMIDTHATSLFNASVIQLYDKFENSAKRLRHFSNPFRCHRFYHVNLDCNF